MKSFCISFVHKSQAFFAGVSLACMAAFPFSASAQPKGHAQNGVVPIQPMPAEIEKIRIKPGQLPDVTLTSSVLFRILASEISAQRSQYQPAASTMLDLARETGDPRLSRRALEFFLASGNLPGALEASRVWLRQSPTDQEAVSTEMALAAAAGQTAGLTETLKKKIQSASNKKEAIGQVLGILGRMPDRRAAFQILDRVLTDSGVKNSLAAHIALADMAQAAGESARALSEAKLALATSPRSEEAAMRVFEYGLRVDPDQALKDSRAFIQSNPGARRLRLMLASQLSDRRDFDGAMQELADMQRRAPEDFDLLYMQAQIAHRAKRLDQARAFLDQFVAVQSQRQKASAPGSTDAGGALADAYLLLSRIAEEQGRYDDAIADLSRIEDPASRYSSRLRQATIRAKQGRVDEALAMIDAANPQDEEETMIGALTVSQILKDASRIPEAIERLKVADQALPESLEIKYELAMLQEKQNNLKEMERLLREVIELDPGHAHAYNALGYSLADRNVRLKEANELITRALEISPNDPFILDSMGWVKFRQGNLAEALKYLERAYGMRPEADIAAHMGEVLWLLGRKDDARKVWSEGYARDPKNETLVETTRRFGWKP